MEGAAVKRRDLERLFKRNGWWFLRSGGDHDIWTNGKREAAIARHREIKEATAQRMIKEQGLR